LDFPLSGTDQLRRQTLISPSEDLVERNAAILVLRKTTGFAAPSSSTPTL
jgi:hypothetical protein